jgi:hypothetical protein
VSRLGMVNKALVEYCEGVKGVVSSEVQKQESDCGHISRMSIQPRL